VALDPSWHSRALLPFGALWRRISSHDGRKEEEEEKIEGYSRQPACTRPCCGAYRRGAAGVIAYGATAVGADGRADNGGDGSDGPNGNAHDGRKRLPADSYPYSSVRNASDECDADACARSNIHDAGDAGDWWVRNAGVSSNEWWRLRDAGVAPDVLNSLQPRRDGGELGTPSRGRPSDHVLLVLTQLDVQINSIRFFVFLLLTV